MSLFWLITVVIFVAGLGFSARWNWWRRPLPGVPILMYHKVGDPPPGSQLKKLWVSADMFRRQMAYLVEAGYHAITFKDIYAFWDKNIPLPPNPILITFDDGYANNYETAFPILRSFGFKATLYVVVQTVGWDNRWHDPKSETRIPMISWAQLKDLQKAGWEIGSHTMNHSNLQKIELKDVTIEMEKSRAIITEFLEEKPDSFAYPYGSGADVPAIRDRAKQAGYRSAVSVHSGKWTLEKMKDSPFNLPRIFVRGGESMFEFKLQLSRGRSRF